METQSISWCFWPTGKGTGIGQDVGVVNVSVQGIVRCGVTYAGDGTYLAQWTPRVIGTFQVDITLEGNADREQPVSHPRTVLL